MVRNNLLVGKVTERFEISQGREMLVARKPHQPTDVFSKIFEAFGKGIHQIKPIGFPFPVLQFPSAPLPVFLACSGIYVCLFLDEFEETINSCSGNSWYGVLS